MSWLPNIACSAPSRPDYPGTKASEPPLTPPIRGAGYLVERADPLRHGQALPTLVNRMYAWRGLSAGVVSLTHSSPHQITLVAAREDEVFGTLTLGLDSPQRLLADQLYAQELNFFRRQGHQLCEITRLAVDTPRKSKEVLAALFHLAYIHGRLIHGATDVFIEVNPRHAPFYCRMLGFRQIGPQRLCPRVNAPAVLLHLESAHIDEQIARFGGSAGQGTRSLYAHFLSPEQATTLLHQMTSRPAPDAAGPVPGGGQLG